MKKTIDCFVPFADAQQANQTVPRLKSNDFTARIFLLKSEESDETISGCETLKIEGLTSTATMKAIAEAATADYVLLYTKYNTLKMGMFAQERMVKLAEDSQADMLYADHYQVVGNVKTNAPVID